MSNISTLLFDKAALLTKEAEALNVEPVNPDTSWGQVKQAAVAELVRQGIEQSAAESVVDDLKEKFNG